jgi:hypothetical protein
MVRKKKARFIFTISLFFLFETKTIKFALPSKGQTKMLDQRSCFLSECYRLDIMPPSHTHTHTKKKKKKKKKGVILGEKRIIHFTEGLAKVKKRYRANQSKEKQPGGAQIERSGSLPPSLTADPRGTV